MEDEVEKAVKEGSCGGGRVMVLQSSLALSKTWRSARRSTMEVKAAEARLQRRQKKRRLQRGWLQRRKQRWRGWQRRQ